MIYDRILDRAIKIVQRLHDDADPNPLPAYDVVAAQDGLNRCRRDGCRADAVCASCGQCAFHCTGNPC